MLGERDVPFINKGLFEMRTKPTGVMAGLAVDINGERYDKPGENRRRYRVGSLKEKLKYVSRGGLKLKKLWKYSNCQLKA